MERPPTLTRTQRALIAVVIIGAAVIAGIGAVGSYTAVRRLAERKGFGEFSAALPIGVDAGICVLLALDLLLTWLRIPFPLLRQTAWVLTAGTIIFNAAASFGDPLAMGMHAIIPLLFVVVIEAARHAVGRIADITADRHMESVRLTRWLLAPRTTFALWRRMKLWELRSYEEVVRLEQNRLVYQTQLRARYGRSWRRTAPVRTLLPLKLARLGIPIPETPPALEEPASQQLPAAPRKPPANNGTPGGSRRRGTRTRPPRPANRPQARTAAPHPAAPQQPAGGGPVDHAAAIAAAATNADAIRYALTHNPAADDQTLVTWLSGFGREVNRGHVYRIRSAAPAAPSASTAP